jgi:CubicO group peptidase (beta-lactamase class C family)
MNHISLLFFNILAIISLSENCLASEKIATSDSAEKRREIDQFMSALYVSGQFTGAVLVAEHGHVIYKKAFGMADREYNKPFTLQTQEYIGSVSKQFTAMGIMILKERGKLNYDQPVREIFPELPECMLPVTIRHLLYHTSGLATFDDFPDMTEEDVFKILMEQKTLHFRPGEKFEYCNAGYSLLGMIIEKISGQSLNEFLSENIFRPLGMNHTSVNEIINRNSVRAVGYDMFGTQNNYDTFMGGNASVISTVEDLYIWDQALYRPSIVRGKTLEEAFCGSSIRLNDEVFGKKSYGFGWWITEKNGSKSLFHDGAFGGYRAYIERFLTEQNTIIQISNLRHPFTLDIRNAIVNILNNQPYVLPKKPINIWTFNQIRLRGADSAVQQYKRFKKTADSSLYSFNESELNSLGYYLLRQNRTSDAIKIFILNCEEYPHSANAFDSLGEAYMISGDKPSAIKNYKLSLKLDPGNYNAQNVLKKLEDEK